MHADADLSNIPSRADAPATTKTRAKQVTVAHNTVRSLWVVPPAGSPCPSLSHAHDEGFCKMWDIRAARARALPVLLSPTKHTAVSLHVVYHDREPHPPMPAARVPLVPTPSPSRGAPRETQRKIKQILQLGKKNADLAGIGHGALGSPHVQGQFASGVVVAAARARCARCARTVAARSTPSLH